MAGFFITLEGIDFCGKSEQAQRLAKKLHSSNHAVHLIRDPGTTVISEKIREILLSTRNHTLCRETEVLLFAAARAQMVAESILPELAVGKVVICERFYDSTTAYQGYGRQIDLNIISMLNAFASQNRKPDLTFVIDIDPAVAYQRQQLAGRQLDRMEQETQQFRTIVRNGFLEIARNEPERIVVINGDDSFENIANQIWQVVRKNFSTRLR